MKAKQDVATYTQWVVGNSRTRAADSNWPGPGAVIRRSADIRPIVIDDQTVVETRAGGLLNLLPDRLVLPGVAPRHRECLWPHTAMAERLEPEQVPKRRK